MKKKVTLLCAVAAMGIAAAAGISLQNRAQLSDVALANIRGFGFGRRGNWYKFSLCLSERFLVHLSRGCWRRWDCLG